MKQLERDGRAQPRARGAADVAARYAAGWTGARALTVPELSVLMAWTKIVLADELLATDLPDDPYLDLDLTAYFPKPMQEGFPGQIERAPAAPRDHRDPGGQRPGQRRRHDVLAAAGGGDRRDRRPS